MGRWNDVAMWAGRAAGGEIVAEMRPFQTGDLGLAPALSGAGLRGEQQALVAGSMAASLAGLLLLMFLLLLLLLVLACRPWRFLSSRRLSSAIASCSLKVDDIERPLFTENSLNSPYQCCDSSQNVVDDSNFQIDGNINSPRPIGIVRNVSSPRKHVLINKKKVSTDFQISMGDSLVLDVISDASEDLHIGQTLKRSAVSSWPVEGAKHVRLQDSDYGAEFIGENDKFSLVKEFMSLRSNLILEVIDGPSTGLHCSRSSKDTATLPLTLGRVSPSNVVLKDSEVSGKHALINWNMHKSKWELVDMGSLNGTFLNSKVIHHPDAGDRRWSEPVELSSGDIITLGSSSKISVQIIQDNELELPLGIGVASDPMAMRRGGKKLPMEDMFYCRWLLSGAEQFGIFCIFDGHGGAGAARASSTLLPENIIKMLSSPENRETIFSHCDASSVLMEAFSRTEAALNHQYEGCTATVLLVWIDYNDEMFAQCANVGDSACILNISGKLIMMTEDHRVISISERTRLSKSGKPLKEGETRLSGLNLGRMLGDKFLKELDKRFSAEPYVSQVARITDSCSCFGLIASDGLWDVISHKQAVQLVLQAKERYNVRNEDFASKVANYILSEARTLRTKDNTSIIFLDFSLMRANSLSNH
ncbi:Protein phosphatase 2C 70 [Apostasia shenzhenica]|uniref:protein-serine/threonine phosphatase n=1 Tax=Apostasia shenzhenica TaxID=1088818 RepID=A0A2I0AUU5_9ASPA|nr:Protein phosphatase 2C 70 [Apostasia shenzhenica]